MTCRSRVHAAVAVVLAVTALCGCAGPRASQGPRAFRCEVRGGHGWRELTTEHFVLRTDLDALRGRQVAHDLEYMRALVAAAVGAVPEGRSERVEVFAFRDREQLAEFLPPALVGSFVVDAVGRQRLLVAGGLELSTRTILAHELAHLLSYGLMFRQPRWFAEGWATYLATVARDGPRMKRFAGAIPEPSIVGSLVRGPLPARDILAWKSLGEADRDETRLYASSWALVHFLANRRPDGFAAYRQKLARLQDPQVAWNEVFPEWKADSPPALELLDQELRKHLQTPGWTPHRIDVSPGDDAAEERPLSAAEVHGLRLALPRSRRSAEAIAAEVDEGLQEDPTNVAVLSARAALHPREALALARRAVAAHPEDASAWILLGTGLARPSEDAERELALRRAVALAPRRPEGLLALEVHLLLVHAAEEAERVGARAVEVAPWSPLALNLHGLALARLGRCDAAAQEIQRGLDVVRDQMTREVRERLAAATATATGRCTSPVLREADDLVMDARREAMTGGDDLRVVALLERAVALDPLHPEAWEQLGVQLLRLGRARDAQRALERQVAVVPQHPSAWLSLGRARATAGDRAGAEAAFRRQVEVAPRNPGAYIALGNLLVETGRHEEAIPELQRAWALGTPTQGAAAMIGIGRARLALGDLGPGAESLAEAVNRAPDCPTLNSAAYALADAGARLDLARGWAERALAECSAPLAAERRGMDTRAALRATRALAAVWDTVGWIRFREGRTTEALRWIAPAERIRRSAAVSEHLGHALEGEGRTDEAAKAYARALASGAPRPGARRRLEALVGAEQVAAAVENARGASGPWRALAVPRGTAAPGAATLIITLGAGGSVLEVEADGAGALPSGTEALRGLEHAVAFPDARAAVLVVHARWQCDANGCTATFPVGAQASDASEAPGAPRESAAAPTARSRAPET